MQSKKFFVAMAIVLMLASSANAFMITDPGNDAIGTPIFETYGINVYNYTPGVNSGGISFSLFTNFPQAGTTVNGTPPWTVIPADVFITETYYGIQYDWAVPLVSHDGLNPGYMYAVGTFRTSDQLDPSGGTGYVYNHNIPVQVATPGNNYGHSSFSGGPVTWNSLGAPGNPDWRVDVNLGVWQDDPNGIYAFRWGTATCANDVISGQIPAVPIPPSAFLLGSGLIGLVGLGWRRRKTND